MERFSWLEKKSWSLGLDFPVTSTKLKQYFLQKHRHCVHPTNTNIVFISFYVFYIATAYIKQRGHVVFCFQKKKHATAYIPTKWKSSLKKVTVYIQQIGTQFLFSKRVSYVSKISTLKFQFSKKKNQLTRMSRHLPSFIFKFFCIIKFKNFLRFFYIFLG